MIKYESVYTETNRRKKNKYEPKRFTIISRDLEDIEFALDFIRQCFDDKGYALLGNFCIRGCLDLLDNYNYDDLQEYGWDKNFFDVDGLRVQRTSRGLCYVELEAPMKMAL